MPGSINLPEVTSIEKGVITAVVYNQDHKEVARGNQPFDFIASEKQIKIPLIAVSAARGLSAEVTITDAKGKVVATQSATISTPSALLEGISGLSSSKIIVIAVSVVILLILIVLIFII